MLRTALLAAAVLIVWRHAPEDAPTDIDMTSAAVGVIDGDTLVVGGRSLRLRAIDAPELAQSCGANDGPDWPCGTVARDALSALIAGGNVSCEARGHDRHGRDLVECSAGADRQDIAFAMVRAGMAVSTEPGLAIAQVRARLEGKGLWRGSFQRPAEYRAAHPRETWGGAPGHQVGTSVARAR